jgi:hypothetical protein
MRTKLKSIILLFIIIVSMAGAAPIARIMKSEGNVLIKRMGKSTFTIPGKPGLGINNGDAIKVGEEGFMVAIFIDDKSVIKIKEKTQFEFIESSNSRTLDVEQGTMFFDIKKEGRKKTFRVETPVSVASVKGTEFAVVSSPAGIDQVFCASGQLDVQNLISGQSVVVGPGQKAISNAMGNVMELPFTPDDYPADPEGVQPKIQTKPEPEPDAEQPQQQQRQRSTEQESQEDPEAEPEEEPDTEGDQRQEQTESDDTPSESRPGKPEPKKPFGLGLGVGSVTIDGALYNQIALRPEINIGKIGIGLDLVFYIDNDGNIKEDEWDFKSDPSRIFDKILFLRWGEESDPFWVKFGSLDNVTLGYGGILSGYSNMMEFPTVRRIGLNTGMNIAGFGGQLFMSNMKDFNRGGTLLGLRGTYKVSDRFPLTVGINFITDMNQFSGLKDIDEDTYPDIFDDFPDNANLWNDTDGDGISDYNGGLEEPEDGWDIDGDGDNNLANWAGGTDVEELKGKPFSIADNKSSVTGFAFDIGYPLLKNKSFSLNVYTEFNFLSFPEVGSDGDIFYRPEYSGKSFSIPGLRASLFNFLQLSYEFRIKTGYFVPQFFDQSYDIARVVPEYIDGSAIVKTKDMALFADSSMNVGLGGHFGSISADAFGFGSLYGSYTNMTSEMDTVNSFVAALTLNAERIPKLSEATAFYQRSNDKNPFDFENPSVNTVMGYRLGYELGKGISVIMDYREFYRYTGALNDDGTGKLEPVVQTTIETSFNF